MRGLRKEVRCEKSGESGEEKAARLRGEVRCWKRGDQVRGEVTRGRGERLRGSVQDEWPGRER